MTYTKAIVRIPGANYTDGLTSAALGRPSVGLALQQHKAYCQALEDCGLALTCLEADPRYPDGTFVEDTAVLAPNCTVITRLGAESRRGEEVEIQETLRQYDSQVQIVAPPGTLEGGDVCDTGGHYLIGISARTNPSGAQQLAEYLGKAGYTATLVDVRESPGLLHLKSGLAYLGNNTLVAWRSLAGRLELAGYHIIPVDDDEHYAANCVLINDVVLLPAGYPKIHRELIRRGYDVKTLDMTEFEKMDGGLSCLSLRF